MAERKKSWWKVTTMRRVIRTSHLLLLRFCRAFQPMRTPARMARRVKAAGTYLRCLIAAKMNTAYRRDREAKRKARLTSGPWQARTSHRRPLRSGAGRDIPTSRSCCSPGGCASRTRGR